jgi:cytochrome c oxidase assembly protein subunit 11
MTPSETRKANLRVVRRLLFVVVGMFGFGFALVPLYDVFCDVTGLNGKTGSRKAEFTDMVVDQDRTVTVEFIANLNDGMPWEFRPAVNKVHVHPGEPFTTSFYAKNLSDKTMVGHAVPSVAPGWAAQHFKKTECFCFTEQVFGAGKGRDMPLRFVVDPELPDKVEVITLSYTFFDTGKLARTETVSSLEEISGPGQ